MSQVQCTVPLYSAQLLYSDTWSGFSCFERLTVFGLLLRLNFDRRPTQWWRTTFRPRHSCRLMHSTHSSFSLVEKIKKNTVEMWFCVKLWGSTVSLCLCVWGQGSNTGPIQPFFTRNRIHSRRHRSSGLSSEHQLSANQLQLHFDFISQTSSLCSSRAPFWHHHKLNATHLQRKPLEKRWKVLPFRQTSVFGAVQSCFKSGAVLLGAHRVSSECTDLWCFSQYSVWSFTLHYSV